MGLVLALVSRCLKKSLSLRIWLCPYTWGFNQRSNQHLWWNILCRTEWHTWLLSYSTVKICYLTFTAWYFVKDPRQNTEWTLEDDIISFLWLPDQNRSQHWLGRGQSLQPGLSGWLEKGQGLQGHPNPMTKIILKTGVSMSTSSPYTAWPLVIFRLQFHSQVRRRPLNQLHLLMRTATCGWKLWQS